MSAKRSIAAFAAAALGLLVIPSLASAEITHTLFAGNGGTAAWVSTDPPRGSTGTQSVRLKIPDADAFAGVRLNGFDDESPLGPPSFDFKSNVASAQSGGSPRLRIRFDDGGSIDLRPLQWTGGEVWQHVDGSSSNWDNDGNGGACGFQFQITYDQALSCHPGADVVGVHVVTDSGWLVSPYTHWVDNITYDGTTISKQGTPPQTCSIAQVGNICVFPR